MRQGYERHDYERQVRDADWDDERPRRRGVIARAVSLIKLAVFLVPVALFAASYLVTDCGARSGTGIGQLFRAGACARGEILNGALSLPADLGILRRAMD